MSRTRSVWSTFWRPAPDGYGARLMPFTRPLLQAQLEAEAAGHLGYARLLTELHLRENPEHLPTLLTYAHHEISFCQYTAAQDALTRAHALASEPHQLALVCLQEGHLLHAQGQFAAAELTFLNAQELEPDDAHGLTYAAASALEAGELARARELGLQAVQCRDGCLDEAWAGLAACQRALGELEEAAASARRALALDPDNPVLQAIEFDAESALEFTRAGRPQPAGSAATEMLFEEAWSAEEAGYPACALYHNGQVLALQPNHLRGLAMSARLLTELARYGEAAAAIDRLRRHASERNRPQAFLLQGSLLARQGRRQAALAAFLEAHRADPEEATPLAFAADAAFRHGNLGLAQELARRATTCPHGQLDEAWQNFGQYLVADRRFAEAADCFHRALELDPGSEVASAGLRDVELLSAHPD